MFVLTIHFQGHSAKSQEWETPAENLKSSVAILSSEIPLFSNLSEFVGSCWELSGVVGNCWELSGVCQELWGAVGTCQELLGLVGSLLGLVGTCWEWHLAKPFWWWAWPCVCDITKNIKESPCLQYRQKHQISTGTINCCSSCDMHWPEAPCSELLGVVRHCWEFVRSCQDLSGVVGTCRELSGVCWEFVGTCQEESGMWISWNLTLRELQLWLIKFWPNSLFPRFCGVSLDRLPISTSKEHLFDWFSRCQCAIFLP